MGAGLRRSRHSLKLEQFRRTPNRCHADEVFLLFCDTAKNQGAKGTLLGLLAPSKCGISDPDEEVFRCLNEFNLTSIKFVRKWSISGTDG